MEPRTPADAWPDPLPEDVDELCEVVRGLSDAQRDALLETLRVRDAGTARLVEGLTAIGRRSSAANDLIGLTIGPYRIERPLARGGMASVFLATQAEPLQRTVVVKVADAALSGAGPRARFDTERAVLARLDHPAIAKVFDAGQLDDGRPYFVMEYLEGDWLTRAADTWTLDVDQRVALLSEVCDAIHHAHRRAVLHRDIKPSNVLAVERDGEHAVCVIDFGIAKVLAGADGEITAGDAAGTPYFMSPEQIDGHHDLDTRTDVYSLGLLAYELLVGRRPWDADTPIEHFRAVARDEPPTLTARLKGLRPDERTVIARGRGTTPGALTRRLSGELEWIVRRATESDREARYDSAAALADDLRRHLDGRPVKAAPATWTYTVGKFVRRHRIAVTASLVTLAALAGAVWLALRSARLESDHALETARLETEHARDLADQEREQARRMGGARLQALLDREHGLWPVRADSGPALTAWLDEAVALGAERDFHREQHRLAAAEPGRERDVALHGVFLDLLPELEAAIARVQAAGEVARLLGTPVAEERWDRLAADWSDLLGAAGWQPDDLRHDGLVPLGPDPGSGLEEFADRRTGTPPTRDANGRLVHAGERAVVFVLIPGGHTVVGSDQESIVVPVDTRTDPTPRPEHIDVRNAMGSQRQLSLAPYLLSKYELTQGQWRRLAGRPASEYHPEHPDLVPGTITLHHPVESVTRREARRVLARYGMDLPTEAQWEHAARGGWRGIFWCGDDPYYLTGRENIADETYARFAGNAHQRLNTNVQDGFVLHAPVGSLAPNPFGLHDMLGNVAEWCREDRLVRYDTPAEGGEGWRAPGEGDRRFDMSRGGSFSQGSHRAAIVYRAYRDTDLREQNIGVRPLLLIDALSDRDR